VDLQIHHYAPEQQRQFVGQVTAALEARPEISRSAAIDFLPLNMGNQQTVIHLPGRDPLPDVGMIQTDFASVTPGYFQTMEIPLAAGRDFSPADRPGATPVAIVNQAIAERVWPGENPVGKTFTFGEPGETPVEVVGLARNSKVRSLGERPVPLVYLPFAQNPSARLTLVARGSAEATLGGLMRQAIHEADPALPLLNIAPITSIIGVSLLPNRIAAGLAGLLGGIGLVLATVGLYGLLAFSVTRRRREIGVRMALGAQPRDVRRLILRQGLGLTLTGLVVGFGLALAATRLVAALLFGVSPLDPLTFGGIAAVLAVTAAIACLVPAIRATRTDPMIALRYD
jgi:predicted permease